MSHAGVNMATTQDGESYNKLRRPDDYMEALRATPPPNLEPAVPPPKRKYDDANNAAEGGNGHRKKFKEAQVSRPGAQKGKGLAGDIRRVKRPIRENGMQTMFPGLDDEGSSGSADEDTRDALAYLRSVRSEASNIPSLLVARPQTPENEENDRSMYNNGVGDHRAVYEDGTWVAVDDYEEGGYYNDDDEWYEDQEDLDPQDTYHRSLLARYEALRTTLATADPSELAALVQANPEKYTNTTPAINKFQWRRDFDEKFPTPACVAQIDERSLYRVLGYLSQIIARDDTISKQMSCWTWTLLAKVGEPGTLDYNKVGRIRELGHKAGQLNVRLRSGQFRDSFKADDEEEVEEWDVDGESIDGEEVNGDGTFDEGQATRNGSGAGQLGEDLKDATTTHSDSTAPVQGIAQWDGADEQTFVESEGGKNNVNDIPSEDEGEIAEEEPKLEDEPIDMEAARARLLAQLGDRLVTTSIPEDESISPKPEAVEEAHNEPRQEEVRQGPRHRHNGKVCRNPACRVSKNRQEARRKAALRAEQKKAPKAAESAGLIANERRREGNDSNARDSMAHNSHSKDTESHAGMGVKAPDQQTHEIEMDDADEASDSVSESGHPREVDLNTKVTIDMILTVVGERYGQKDLLRFRDMW